MQMAASYLGHLLVTIWRRKSTLLGACAGLVLLLLCLQYSSVGNGTRPQAVLPHSPSQEALKSLRILHRSEEASRTQVAPNSASPAAASKVRPGVRFVPTVAQPVERHDMQEQAVVDEVRAAELALRDTPSRDEIALARRRGTLDRRQVEQKVLHVAMVSSVAQHLHQQQPQQQVQHSQQQQQQQGAWNYMYQGAPADGLPTAELDPEHPYVPEHRLVHLDLKGAPPKIEFLKKLFPFVRQLGATGLLLEWEDMYPFKGGLAGIATRNHYSRREVFTILELAKTNQLEVIPLVQTFGHLEFALKHPAFEHLREVSEIPQALCPSQNASFLFIQKMVEQVMSVHKKTRFLHIGCDEVFHMGECSLCRQHTREDLFLDHVVRVARWVRSRFNVTPIIWDDMLRQIPVQLMEKAEIGSLVEPMVWVYAEDVYRFVPTGVWDKYARVFSHAWAASAFKGAFGETLVVPDVRRHLENNLKWLEVMSREGDKFTGGFRGIAITGWQRYDHFAVLCELLPAGVPSLAVNLIATSHGFFNQSLRRELFTALGCAQTPKYESFLNLVSDPYLWDKVSWCFFPGSGFFKLTARLTAVEREVAEYLSSITRSKAWLTDFNIRHNFSSPMRLEEALAEHPRIYHTVLLLLKTAKEALSEAFDMYTVAEWIEQKIYPMLKSLEDLEKVAQSMKEVKVWPARPFPPLSHLRKYGISLETNEQTDNNNNIQENKVVY